MEHRYFRYLPMMGKKEAEKAEDSSIELRNVLQVLHNACRVFDKQKSSPAC